MAEAVPTLIEEAARELGIPAEELRRRIRAARDELSRKVREFWLSDSGRKLADVLSFLAYASGYADELRSWWDEAKRAELRRIAEATNIGGLYRYAWGKPTKRR